MKIGNRIRLLRELKGMTQAEVGERLSVKRETVNQWENNVRDLKTKHTIKLADLFGVTCDEILKGLNLEKIMSKYNLNKKINESELKILKENAKNEFCFKFAVRLRECFLNKPDICQQELANYSKCFSPSSVSAYLQAQQKPSAESVLNISRIFNVSSDYLLGITKVPTTKTDLRSVCDYLGLSQESVNNLMKLDVNLFDWFLSNDDAVKIMKDMFSYAQTRNKSFYASVIENLALICN